MLSHVFTLKIIYTPSLTHAFTCSTHTYVLTVLMRTNPLSPFLPFRHTHTCTSADTRTLQAYTHPFTLTQSLFEHNLRACNLTGATTLTHIITPPNTGTHTHAHAHPHTHKRNEDKKYVDEFHFSIIFCCRHA